MSKKQKKKIVQKWNYFQNEFVIKDVEGLKQIPIFIFIEEYTGELRLFSRKKVEKVGINNIKL